MKTHGVVSNYADNVPHIGITEFQNIKTDFKKDILNEIASELSASLTSHLLPTSVSPLQYSQLLKNKTLDFS
jgi:hypothetical protein